MVDNHPGARWRRWADRRRCIGQGAPRPWQGNRQGRANGPGFRGLRGLIGQVAPDFLCAWQAVPGVGGTRLRHGLRRGKATDQERCCKTTFRTPDAAMDHDDGLRLRSAPDERSPNAGSPPYNAKSISGHRHVSHQVAVIGPIPGPAPDRRAGRDRPPAGFIMSPQAWGCCAFPGIAAP